MAMSYYKTYSRLAACLKEPDGPKYGAECSPKKTVLAIDDDPQVRRLLFRILNCDRFSVTCAGNMEEAVFFISRATPQLVLLDLHLSSSNDFGGLECIHILRKAGYANPIYMLSVEDSFDQVHAAAKAGANGYLVKNASRAFWKKLNGLINETLSGTTAISRDLTPEAVAYLKTRHLTDADIRLLAEFVKDYGREKEIARVLDCTEAAVRKKFQSIRDRLGAASQADLARMIGVLSCL
jgi:DNA-binding NarL/FixJ family response regulator